jgi:hypothetical protein
VIKLLYWFGLLTREEADKLEGSHVPLRTSTLANAGLAVLILGLLGAFATCTVGIFSSSIHQNQLPLPPEPTRSPTSDTEPLRLDQEARDAFRDKVDRLQQELNQLVIRQAELEAKLEDKTAESQEQSHLAQQLRKELVSKQHEIDSINAQEGPGNWDRQFVPGSTAYTPPPGGIEEVPDFIKNIKGAKRATAPPEFPGEIVIALTPTNAQSGDHYRLKVQIHNHGNRTLLLTELELTWSYAGKNTGGSIPFQVRSVEPRTTELLHQVEGVWFEDLHTATIIATVTLKDGGRLTNSLSWQGG